MTRKVWTDPPVRGSEAIWLEKPVPSGYWQDPDHRRLYMRWLGQQLGYRKPEDWYRIKTDDFKNNRGSTVLALYWNSSAIAAVRQYLPGYDWKEWLFGTCPRAFWKERANRRRYMEWLGSKLGFRRPEDWYQVTNRDFSKNKGGALMLFYDSTISAAVKDCFPEYDWEEWKFSWTPKFFWERKKNRQRYLRWLGEKLGFEEPDDWYAITGRDITRNCGNQLLKRYQGSTIKLINDSLPPRRWKEWMFSRVPVGYWEDVENRKRYVRWLGRHLGIKQPADWHQVRQRDIARNCGGALLHRYPSYVHLLRECVTGYVELQSGGAVAMPGKRRSTAEPAQRGVSDKPPVRSLNSEDRV